MRVVDPDIAHTRDRVVTRTGPGFLKVLVPLVIGAFVASGLGFYGAAHTGTGEAVYVTLYSSPLTAKVWLTTGAAGLALVQLASARMMYRMEPLPAWVARTHRWAGRAAFLLALPVAVHCLYALGFQTFDTRVLAHSLLGCLFFGAFTVKMLVLTQKGVPDRVLPWLGGLVFALLVGVWLTSSLWFFTTVGLLYY